MLTPPPFAYSIRGRTQREKPNNEKDLKLWIVAGVVEDDDENPRTNEHDETAVAKGEKKRTEL